MRKSCVIIGSEGYLGKHIVHYAPKFGYDIVGCYDIADIGQSLTYTSVDLTSKTSVQNIRTDVDYIFLFAGLTGTYAGFNTFEKYLVVNELGLLNLLDHTRNTGSHAKIIFPSTRLVYKGSDNALKEEAEKETKTIYAVNKLACEAYLHAYSNAFGIPYTIYRICVPYGNEISGDYSFGTIGFFLKNASSGKAITLYGGGTLKRTFTHVADISKQILETACLPQTKNEIYNIAGETYSLREVAEIVNRNYGVEINKTDWPVQDLKIESGDTYFDAEKICKLLNSQLQFSLQKISF